VKHVLVLAVVMLVLTFVGIGVGGHAVAWLVERSAAEHAACVVRAGVEHFDSIKCP
jgi:hypothetical protein